MKTILAIDSDKWAVETYRANFPGVCVECGPVANFIPRLPAADIILAGFPCQPHSLAGKRGASSDARDGGADFIAAIDKVRPRMFLGENVAGILSSEDGRYVHRLVAGMEAAGYVVQIRTLDAVNFGVPQFRVRVWFWGIRADLYRDGMRHVWPKPTHAWPPPGACMFDAALEAGITVGQALGLDGWIKKDTGAGFVDRGGERRVCSTEEPAQTITADNVGGAGCRRTFIARGDRGTGIIERHGDRPVSPITEPAPSVGNGENGSSRMYLQSHADPAQTIDKPAPALRSGGGGHDGCCLRLQLETGSKNRYRHSGAESRGSVVHGVDEPSFCIDGTKGPDLAIGIQQGHGNVGDREFNPNEPAPTMRNCLPGCSDILLYRWSDAMLYKHAPASPAPTVQAKWFKGGAEGLLQWKKTDDGLWVRRLTPVECMRLQSAPDDFRWPDGIGKTAMYRVCGNGWASRMGQVFSEAFAAVDPEARTVVDLFSGGGLGAVGWHGKSWKYEPMETAR